MAPRKKAAKKGRGAKAPRSAFRAKPAAKTTKAAPKKVKAAPKKQAAAPKRSAAVAPAARIEPLGTITCPSGTLAIFDIGLHGYLPRPALEPAIVKASVPADRALSVVGARVGRGRFSDCWDHISVVLGDGEVHASKKLGEAGVDFARLVCVDHAALDEWQHDESLDGLADVMFWGRDEKQLAAAMRAPRTREGYGWSNLTVEIAEMRLIEAERKKAENKWLLATDFRPHSHHYHALAAARANPKGAGEMELGDSRMLLFFTSWGDGVYPIYLDTDHDDHPVRVRIQLATEESKTAMHAVNRR
jgi:hypothetical protein